MSRKSSQEEANQSMEYPIDPDRQREPITDSQHASDSALSAEALARIDYWVAKFPDDRKRSAVLAALTIAQEENDGWLSTQMMDAVADHLDLPNAWVYECGTFYSLFHLEPIGRNEVAICTNISCMLRGSDEIVRHVEDSLDCKLGETTEDNRITLKIEEECLAACCGAPMMVVNGHYHENLTPDRVDRILEELE